MVYSSYNDMKELTISVGIMNTVFLLECLLVMCWKNILREILLGLNVTNVSFLNKLRGEYIDKIQYMFQNISFRGV